MDSTLRLDYRIGCDGSGPELLMSQAFPANYLKVGVAADVRG